jgi:hypothetical protein
MYYKKLDIDDFEKIQELIVPYVIDYVNQNITEQKLFYNLIPDEDLQKFKQEIPELFESIRNHLGSEVLFISYLFIDNHSHVPIHTDANNPLVKKRIRLNWPILNGSSASTIFYKKNSENIEGTLSSLSNGVTGHYYSIENCYEVDKYVLDSPTLMNVKELHGIKILNHKLPRILLSMRLSNEEQVYQKYF